MTASSTIPALISVDWGTTSCRASLMDRAGRVIETRGGGPGILAVKDQAFEAALANLIGDWRTTHGAVPVILSGMIGSRQGWHEAPYVRCPAGAADIARALATIDTKSFGRIALIPGLDTRGADSVPDVMRGEETQIVGALDAARSGVFVLPGTHAKWVAVEDGKITGFRTFMTGEVFAALKDHTILGRLMSESAAAQPQTDAAFIEGVKRGASNGGPGALLNRIFATRTLGLFGQMEPGALADYLSGLLIGAEIVDGVGATRGPVTIIANDALTQRYTVACGALGITSVAAPPDCAARGAVAIARASGVLA